MFQTTNQFGITNMIYQQHDFTSNGDMMMGYKQGDAAVVECCCLYLPQKQLAKRKSSATPFFLEATQKTLKLN